MKIKGQEFEYASVRLGDAGAQPLVMKRVEEIVYSSPTDGIDGIDALLDERFGLRRLPAAACTGTFEIKAHQLREFGRVFFGYSLDSKYAQHRNRWRASHARRRIGGRERKRLERVWARWLGLPVRNVRRARRHGEGAGHVREPWPHRQGSVDHGLRHRLNDSSSSPLRVRSSALLGGIDHA